jgi:hypothetical protein
MPFKSLGFLSKIACFKLETVWDLSMTTEKMGPRSPLTKIKSSRDGAIVRDEEGRIVCDDDVEEDEDEVGDKDREDEGGARDEDEARDEGQAWDEGVAD